jgi:hypothetical protein
LTLSWLKKQREHELKEKDLLDMVKGAVLGMEYLENNAIQVSV